MRHFHFAFSFGDVLDLGGTRFKIENFFNTLNRAGSGGRHICRSRSHPKTSHTALGAV
jgi:hypothetical protein